MSGRAFLFPGQASQAIGMGQDLVARFPEAQALFAEADRVLGFELSKICFEGPMEELTQTSVTQPAVYVHSVAVARLLAARGLVPEAVAGHSLGEYSALTAAGVFDFEVGLLLVRERGRLMQETGHQQPGTMAAVLGLDDDVVRELCAQVGPDVVPANFNCPGQIVISGAVEAVEKAGQAAAAAGATRVVALPVSGAFQSPLMAPAAEPLAERLAETPFAPPSVPVINNVTATPETDPDQLRQRLVEQMTAPVLWTASILRLREMGIDEALEVGPGSVLKGLGRRITRELKITTAGTVEDLDGLDAA